MNLPQDNFKCTLELVRLAFWHRKTAFRIRIRERRPRLRALIALTSCMVDTSAPQEGNSP